MDWKLLGNVVAAIECALCVAWLCWIGIRALCRLPASHLLAFVFLATGATLVAQKTNNVPPNMNSPLPQMMHGGVSFQTGFTGLTGFSGALPHTTSSLNPVNLVNPVQNNIPVQTTIDDISRGWRIESVATNTAVSYTMPTNATLVGNFHVHGAASSFGNNRIDFGDFAFPLGTNNAAFSTFWYFVDGCIRPTPRDSAHEICAVGVPMSAVPGQSRLWTAEAPDGSRVITWDNFFLCGDTNCPINAQIHLYANGDFIMRSNGVETVCRRVNPDDWDGDGIPNDEDVDPCVSDGDFFGPANILPDGANSNAYCTVSVVATGPDALITFAGDNPSGCPDPRFVAKSGETNEVVILVGKTYAISSDEPFEVVDVSDPETEVWRVRGAAHLVYVRRPVSISTSGGNPFMMTVVPANLGGAFSWLPSGCCCTVTGSGDAFAWDCPSDCTCGGCAVEGTYSYEGYWLPVAGCLCGCHYDGTGPTWEPEPAPLAASVSATFSKSAVIFEDAYENLPGQWVAKRSTRTRLNIVASGGPNGATLSVTSANLAKLTRLSGPDLPLAPVSVPAETQVSYSIVYEGNEASEAADDITVTAIVADADNGDAATNECATTSIRLELAPIWEAPENPCTNRHVYGVGEKVLFKVRPQLSSVVLSTTKYDTGDSETSEYELFGTNATVDASSDRIYTCPISANFHPPIKVRCGTVEYDPVVSLVEPQEVVTRGAEWGVNAVDIFYEGNRKCWPSGTVGTATLVTTNYIGPMTVSFRGIAVSELPCTEEDTITGCLTNVRWRTHTSEAGAGWAYPIKAGNFWFVDSAGLASTIANWSDGGELVLRIPIGWHRRGASDDEFGVLHPNYEIDLDDGSRPLVFEIVYRQRYVVDKDGTCRTEKYGHWISRSRYCRVILDGETLQWGHPPW